MMKIILSRRTPKSAYSRHTSTARGGRPHRMQERFAIITTLDTRIGDRSIILVLITQMDTANRPLL